MRVRVPSQRRTKWLILAAALVATLLTWLQVRNEPPRPAPSSDTSADLVEVEIQVEPSGPR